MLLHLLSYVGAITAFLFVTLSLASGLLWVAELIEEHSRAARIIGRRAIYTIIVLHVLLFFTDRLPFWHIVFGIFCQVVYLQHFSSSWPYISLTGATFLLSCALVVADHFMWFFHFAAVAQEAKRSRAARYRYHAHPVKEAPTFMEVASFFAICVWFVPLFLFLSLSANDNVIPSHFGTPTPTPPVPAEGGHAAPRRSRPGASLVKSALAPVMGLIPRIGRRNTEGIIAPRTPGLSPVPSSVSLNGSYVPWGGESSPSSPQAFSPMASYSGLPGAGGSGFSTPPPPKRRVSQSSVNSEIELSGVETGISTGKDKPVRRAARSRVQSRAGSPEP